MSAQAEHGGQVAGPGRAEDLPLARSVLAVCAHPDDESFGLGGALSRFAERGASIAVLCFTHGERSTLGHAGAADLGAVRAEELRAAAQVLGVAEVRLLGYPDGALSSAEGRELAEHVEGMARRTAADLLLVFDVGGITGHPDHEAATAAGVLAASWLDLPVLAWALDEPVARVLNTEFGAAFIGRNSGELDFRVPVDRAKQWQAIACHSSQDVGNRVMRRRLGAQGDIEVFRWLRPRPRARRAVPSANAYS